MARKLWLTHERTACLQCERIAADGELDCTAALYQLTFFGDGVVGVVAAFIQQRAEIDLVGVIIVERKRQAVTVPVPLDRVEQRKQAFGVDARLECSAGGTERCGAGDDAGVAVDVASGASVGVAAGVGVVSGVCDGAIVGVATGA